MARGQGILDVAMSAGKYCLLISLDIAICKTSEKSRQDLVHTPYPGPEAEANTQDQTIQQTTAVFRKFQGANNTQTYVTRFIAFRVAFDAKVSKGCSIRPKIRRPCTRRENLQHPCISVLDARALGL